MLEEAMAPCMAFLMCALSSSGNYCKLTGSVRVFPPPSDAGDLSDTKSSVIGFGLIFPSGDKVLRGGCNAVSRGH